jgi:hypothetical protein
MVHELPKSISDKVLDEKIKFRICGLATLISSIGIISGSAINNRLWKYSVIGWSLAGLGAGLFGMYRTMGYDTKIKLTNFCDKFNKYIGSCFI